MSKAVRLPVFWLAATLAGVVATAGHVQAHDAAATTSAAPAVPAPVAPAPAVPAPVTDGAHVRSLGLAGAPNFRDIGGYDTTDHRHVRWGAVYRSNALDKLTPADAVRVERLDLKAVVDLRTQAERVQAPSVWERLPGDVYESPKESLQPVMSTLLKDAQTPEGARAGVKAFYASMPDLYRDEYLAMFRRIAAGEIPLLVHCTAGKDRTGVAMAVLLRSLKVPRAEVVADYELTGRLLPAPDGPQQSAAPVAAPSAGSALAQIPAASRMVLWQPSPDYIEAALDAIDREYGSVDRYLIRGLGLTPADIASIRRALTR